MSGLARRSANSGKTLPNVVSSVSFWWGAWGRPREMRGYMPPPTHHRGTASGLSVRVFLVDYPSQGMPGSPTRRVYDLCRRTRYYLRHRPAFCRSNGAEPRQWLKHSRQFRRTCRTYYSNRHGIMLSFVSARLTVLIAVITSYIATNASL